MQYLNYYRSYFEEFKYKDGNNEVLAISIVEDETKCYKCNHRITWRCIPMNTFRYIIAGNFRDYMDT